MRHPRDYSVNEAWIVFHLNDAPIRTEEDGDFNVVALMDAATCYIFGNEFVTTRVAEIPEPDAEHLIETGKAMANVLPQKLLLQSELGTAQLAKLAKRLGIKVERVPDKELKVFVSEARECLREHLATGRDQ